MSVRAAPPMSAVSPLTSGKAAIAARMAHRYFCHPACAEWMLPRLDKLERSFTADGGSAKEYVLDDGAPFPSRQAPSRGTLANLSELVPPQPAVIAPRPKAARPGLGR